MQNLGGWVAPRPPAPEPPASLHHRRAAGVVVAGASCHYCGGCPSPTRSQPPACLHRVVTWGLGCVNLDALLLAHPLPHCPHAKQDPLTCPIHSSHSERCPKAPPLPITHTQWVPKKDDKAGKAGKTRIACKACPLSSPVRSTVATVSAARKRRRSSSQVIRSLPSRGRPTTMPCVIRVEGSGSTVVQSKGGGPRKLGGGRPATNAVPRHLQQAQIVTADGCRDSGRNMEEERREADAPYPSGDHHWRNNVVAHQRVTTNQTNLNCSPGGSPCSTGARPRPATTCTAESDPPPPLGVPYCPARPRAPPRPRPRWGRSGRCRGAWGGAAGRARRPSCLRH